MEILIGADVWQAHVIHESVEGEPDQPRALRTGLGWTLFGPGPRTRGSKGYAVNCVQSTNDILYERKKRMFNYDFRDSSQVSDVPYSVEDKQFPQKTETSLTKLNGHYQRELSSKKDDAMLPDNRSRAENPAHLLGGNTSPASASYALRKVADETEARVFMLASVVYISRSSFRGSKCCIHFPLVFSCSQVLHTLPAQVSWSQVLHTLPNRVFMVACVVYTRVGSITLIQFNYNYNYSLKCFNYITITITPCKKYQITITITTFWFVFTFSLAQKLLDCT